MELCRDSIANPCARKPVLMYGGIGIPGYPYTSTTEPTDVSLIHDQVRTDIAFSNMSLI
jgi:hypothetical protein